jgi:TPR repeat protein
VLAFLVALPGKAQNLKKGFAAFKRGDYLTAHGEFRPLAEKGEPLAQVALAQMYYFGRGVQRSYSEALLWFRKAAEHGHPIAQYGLGSMYVKGQGVS